MSDRSVLEEDFAQLFVDDDIFNGSPVPTSHNSYRPTKDLFSVSDDSVGRQKSDNRPLDDDDPNNNIQIFERSFSESLVNGYNDRKSPISPSSPDRKRRKSVTFADSNGGDLVEVREFDNTVDPIQNCLSERLRPSSDVGLPKFVILFPQPCASFTAFTKRLAAQKVSLENAQIVSEDILIGTAKVRNLAFSKQVDVRITMDSWKTFRDVQCKFLHSETADIDVFTFKIQISSDVICVNFCVRFRCNDSEYWDNNDGKNYCVAARDLPPNNNNLLCCE